MQETCSVVQRLEEGGAYYVAVLRAQPVARSRRFDPRSGLAEAQARDQLDRVLRALGWRPVGTGGGLYERGA